MRMIAATALFVVALLTTGAVSIPQDGAPATRQSQPKLELLKELVGEWDVQYKMHMEPGAPPMEADGTDTVRAVGEYFVVAETSFTTMGMTMTGILQIGYIEDKDKYVATWIDSKTSHLWVYKGVLNEAGDTLTLHTEGPSMQNPGATAKYKEVLTVKSNDHRTFSSDMQLDSGEWMTIMTAEYSRKK